MCHHVNENVCLQRGYEIYRSTRAGCRTGLLRRQGRVPAPDIVLKALLPNQPVAAATLDALKGKAIVLEFWATWCAPCVGSIPHLNKLADQFQDRAIQFLSVTSEEAPVVEKFLKARPIHGWVGLDDLDRTYKPYGFEGIPQTVLIDAAGKEIGRAHV